MISAIYIFLNKKNTFNSATYLQKYYLNRKKRQEYASPSEKRIFLVKKSITKETKEIERAAEQSLYLPSNTSDEL